MLLGPPTAFSIACSSEMTSLGRHGSERGGSEGGGREGGRRREEGGGREGGRREGREGGRREEGYEEGKCMSSRQRGNGGGKLINTNHPGTTSKERKGLVKHCILHMYMLGTFIKRQILNRYIYQSCTRTCFPLSLYLFDFYVSVL